METAELRQRFDRLASDGSLTVHRFLQVSDEGVRYDRPMRFNVSGDDEVKLRRFEDACDSAGKMLGGVQPYPPRNNWYVAIFDRGGHRIDLMNENAAVGHCWLRDAAHVSCDVLDQCVDEGWIARSSIAYAASRLRTLLKAIVELGDLSSAGPHETICDELREGRNVLLRAFGQFERDAQALPRHLSHVWTVSVAEEIANLRTAVQGIISLLRSAKREGLNHPIITFSNASDERKKEWIKHELLLYRMVNRLDALDLDPPNSQKPKTTGDPNEGAKRRCGEVIDSLDRLRRSGEPYTTQADLAERLRCSVSLINKAIKKSESLTKWMNDTRKIAPPKAQSLNRVVTDSAVQHVEANPADGLPQDEVDAVMDELIDQAKPEQRADLHALNAEGRQRLVKIFYEQKLDEEPSPLDEADQKIRCHKRM